MQRDEIKVSIWNSGNCFIGDSDLKYVSGIQNHEFVLMERLALSVEVPHAIQVRFKWPPPPVWMTVKCPWIPQGGGELLKLRIDQCVKIQTFSPSGECRAVTF